MEIYLAPLKGITDCIYRTTFLRYFKGVDRAMAPFISSLSAANGARRIKPAYLSDISPENNRNTDLIPQILSNDPNDFLFTARHIFDLGWPEINWNLGCPSPMVTRKKRGSGLLPHQEQICRVLDAVTARWPERISIKTRLGLDSAAELYSLLPVLDQYPLTEIIIHPRLGRQMYKGRADLEAFCNCRPLTRHRLIYNGDITDHGSYSRINQCLPGIERLMLGRGLIADPFLSAGLKAGGLYLKSDSDRDILETFLADLLQQYQERLCGDSHILGRLKGIWRYLAEIFEDSSKIRKKITKTKKLNHYTETVKSIWAEAPFSK
ncbi:tRNA-dihydrouridine synthase family protein [Desulfobacterota bacterium M19]